MTRILRIFNMTSRCMYVSCNRLRRRAFFSKAFFRHPSKLDQNGWNHFLISLEVIFSQFQPKRKYLECILQVYMVHQCARIKHFFGKLSVFEKNVSDKSCMVSRGTYVFKGDNGWNGPIYDFFFIILNNIISAKNIIKNINTCDRVIITI